MIGPSPQSLLDEGRIARQKRRPEDARRCFRDALTGLAGSAEGPLTASLYEELAYVERSLGDLQSSVQHYRQAGAVYQRIGDPLKVAHTIRHAADILRSQNARAESSRLYDEALQIYRDHPKTSSLDLANAIRGFALLKEDQGERGQALALWQEAGRLYELTGVDSGIAECRRRLDLLTGR